MSKFAFKHSIKGGRMIAFALIIVFNLMNILDLASAGISSKRDESSYANIDEV